MAMFHRWRKTKPFPFDIYLNNVKSDSAIGRWPRESDGIIDGSAHLNDGASRDQPRRRGYRPAQLAAGG